MEGMSLPPSPMQSLQAEHERLLARLDETGGAPCPGPAPVSMDVLPFDTQALVHEAGVYIERARAESEWIIEARERSQLRANLRFWASFLLNCTGTYPDTTLLPARNYLSPIVELSDSTRSKAGLVPEISQPPFGEDGEILDETDLPDQDELLEPVDSELNRASPSVRPAWISRISRYTGLAAILIVGAIPLAAVCLALSLFYSLDNQSHWAWSGNFATQTANVASVIPVSTPTVPVGETPVTGSKPPDIKFGSGLPLAFAQVTFGKGPENVSGCSPGLSLALSAPQAIDGMPTPPGDVMVSLAGTDQEIASGILHPGAEPLILKSKAGALTPQPSAWLVQVEHPWLDLEAVIITSSVLEDCSRQPIFIEYQSAAGLETWRAARDRLTSGDLNISWSLLTWGPDALEGLDWVAALKFQSTGGNGKYVYFAEGDLAAPSAASVVDGLLPGDQVVLGQKSCMTSLARVGVTSAGQILRRTVAVQMVSPECR